MKDYIEKHIKINAPQSRVWMALTNYQEFGRWFRVDFDRPFVENMTSSGKITYPGYEQHKLEIIIEKIKPDHLFSFVWYPYALDTTRDYSSEPTSLVEFRLAQEGNATLLSVVESGFDSIAEDRRLEAYKMNEKGWIEQMKNIKDYVEKSI